MLLPVRLLVEYAAPWPAPRLAKAVQLETELVITFVLSGNDFKNLHLAGVFTASQRLVGVEDGVTALDKVGVAGLEGHGVEDDLEGQVLSVGRNAVGVELGLGAVILAVLVDEVPHDLVEDGSPDFADVVHLVVGVEGSVLVRVDIQVRRVQVVSDTGIVVVHPRAQAVVGLTGVAGL